VVFDSSSPIKDARLTGHGAGLAYARSLDVFGMAGKLDALFPFASLSGTAKVFGEERERKVSGLGDRRVRFSLLWYAAPALTPEEFADYKPDFIFGSSLAVTLPLGQYDTHKLVNIGTHRWSFKPEIGVSKTPGPPSRWSWRPAPPFLRTTTTSSCTARSRRTAVGGAGARHLSRPLRPVAGGGHHVLCGRQDDGRRRGRRAKRERAGRVTIDLPIHRHNSVKLYGSTGAVARVGGSFNAAGIAWQYRWGGGL